MGSRFIKITLLNDQVIYVRKEKIIQVNELANGCYIAIDCHPETEYLHAQHPAKDLIEAL